MFPFNELFETTVEVELDGVRCAVCLLSVLPIAVSMVAVAYVAIALVFGMV